MIASCTMEWFYDVHWEVVSMPKGKAYTMTALPYPAPADVTRAE